ncbi:MAG TPA: arginine N-succinyltransferase, partial [Candidatus Methylomirabilis sp.]|nr:arginine N-succinyltransferase [Candidatus Methylomirabilis sp.]
FEARTSDVLLVRRFRTARLAAEPLGPESGEDVLVGVDRESARNRFRAVRTPARLDDQSIVLPAGARELLGISAGARVGVIPFELG